VNFDTVNHLGVTHVCVRQKDEQTNILVTYTALNYVVLPKMNISQKCYDM